MHVQEGKTPLMAAVQEGHLEAARVLVVECNCDTNAKFLVSYSVQISLHGHSTCVCNSVSSLYLDSIMIEESRIDCICSVNLWQTQQNKGVVK